MVFEKTSSFARQLDKTDPLSAMREDFLIPKRNNMESIYLCGNSLGLQSGTTRARLEEQLLNWQELGVEGWFEGTTPWLDFHKDLQELLAPIVGAKPVEVIPMNSLTVNLHLLMVSFFRPSGKRNKILVEAGAFPSDYYAVETQLRFHGLDVKTHLIEVKPRVNEITLRTEDILEVIEKNGEEIALVLFGGINYYTGQFYDLEAITKAGHKAGCIVGFDLAHAAGNVPLHLHRWGADFASWCSYKYLNSGPGGISAAFIHEKHFNSDLIRFAGWWGYKEDIRFNMKKDFIPEAGARGWQLSSSPVLLMAALKASLQVFFKAGGIEVLRRKSILLTSFLEYLIVEINKDLGYEKFRIITPGDHQERGCQLSIVAKPDGRLVFEYLSENGVICDWREPDVIRMAPVPLYNTFSDVFHTGKLLAASSGIRW